jgi:hypothetical protein
MSAEKKGIDFTRALLQFKFETADFVEQQDMHIKAGKIKKEFTSFRCNKDRREVLSAELPAVRTIICMEAAKLKPRKALNVYYTRDKKTLVHTQVAFLKAFNTKQWDRAFTLITLLEKEFPRTNPNGKRQRAAALSIVQEQLELKAK